MTGVGAMRAPRRRVSRRGAVPPLDPRRAPGAFAGSSQTLEPTDGVTTADLPAPHKPMSGIAAGFAAIREALRSIPATPGVYRMLDRKGDALYVGKARNLRSRVQN